jgi:hypothetical protein
LETAVATQLLRELAENRRVQEDGEWTTNAGPNSARARANRIEEPTLLRREFFLGQHRQARRRRFLGSRFGL